MPLVNAIPMLAAARAGRYAVGAFHAHNLEFVQGILRAAEDLSAPVILQVSARAIHYAGLRPMASMVRAAAQEARVPVVMHLNRGDFELNLRCLVAGFSSLMFDGSALPFGMNVEETRRIVEAAHVMGVPVEGELGHVNGKRDGQPRRPEEFTDPSAAQKFVTLTGVDSLAVAVGAVAPAAGEKPKLDTDRLRQIAEATHVPLALHNVQQVPDDEVREAIMAGITKITIGYELHVAFTKALREVTLAEPDQMDPRPLLGAGRTAVTEVVRAKIQHFGSAGKADDVPSGAR